MTVYAIHVNRIVLVCAPNSTMWPLLRILVIVRMHKQCAPGIFSSVSLLSLLPGSDGVAALDCIMVNL